jgi:hypothetical protein
MARKAVDFMKKIKQMANESVIITPEMVDKLEQDLTLPPLED